MNDENGYSPIDCELHDYVEIACLYGYRLRIELVDGGSFNGKAVTTRNTKEEEFLVLIESDGPAEVRLDHLHAMTALDEGAKFGRVVLGKAALGNT